MVAADEAGHFCIPLLSGHVGGANELAERMAGWLNGIPVITTATDVNGVFAVDVFAARNGLCITDRKEAKEISAWLLDGGEVGFFCDSECHGAEGARDICRHNICMNRVCGHNIWITFRNSERPSFLRLVPKMVVVGVGNVCERSCTAGGGILLIHKRAGEGVTVAAAIEPVARAGHSQ